MHRRLPQALGPLSQRRFVRVRDHGMNPRAAAITVGGSRAHLRLHPPQMLFADYNDDLTPWRTIHELWGGGSGDIPAEPLTLGRCWHMLFNELDANAKAQDFAAVRRIEDNDMVALARATARAEMQALLDVLPEGLRQAIVCSADFDVDTVEELFIHVGQPVEVRSDRLSSCIGVAPTVDDIRYILSRVGRFADDGRGCIQGTLHRISCWMGRTGTVLGVTMRVGRYVPGVARPFIERARHGNLLFLSKPGQGKTTMLRDIAIGLSRDVGRPRVVIIDSSNEIGGDSDAPLPYLGRARRLQVPKRSLQQHYMTQAVQNHSPDYVVIDEIATESEAEAALSMSQRGIKLIGTAHGETLSRLVQNKALNPLVGGVAQAFLSNEERKLRNKAKKTCLERPYDAPFHTVVELRSRHHAMMHVQVNRAVDMLLDERNPWDAPNVCQVIRYKQEKKAAHDVSDSLHADAVAAAPASVGDEIDDDAAEAAAERDILEQLRSTPSSCVDDGSSAATSRSETAQMRDRIAASSDADEEGSDAPVSYSDNKGGVPPSKRKRLASFRFDKNGYLIADDDDDSVDL